MSRGSGKVHVVRVRKAHVDKHGNPREYFSAYLRRTYREGKRVRNETVANLSALPEHVVDWIDAGLKGEQLVPAGAEFTICRSLPHGHVAAVTAMAHQLGLPGLLGPACRARDLVLALIVSRVVRPASKLSTLAWWPDVTLGPDLDVAGATTDEIYAAMDWLLDRQEAIEKQLAARHLDPSVNPGRMALFDLTSSWVTGRCCELAGRGYSRDGKKGCEQIEYGILTDPVGRPVAVRVFDGSTADPVAFTKIIPVIRDTFALENLVLVGDRGMITTARIAALRELNDDPDTATDFGWITALRAPQVATLAADDGPLQMSLFDTQDLAEISHPDYPGERLIACRNPALAAERGRKRTELLTATEDELATIAAAVAAGRQRGAGPIGVRVAKIINHYNMAKHFTLDITDTTFSYRRREESIATEAALDGIYVIRTSVTADRLDTAAAVRVYKSLANVEKIFRSLKSVDLHIRPIHHHTENRTRAHVFLCMLAGHLAWHLRQALAPLTFTDEHRPVPENPVTTATRSPQAQTKASTRTLENGDPARSFRTLLSHLATRTRNTLRATGTTTFDLLALPTPTQRQATELIDQHAAAHGK